MIKGFIITSNKTAQIKIFGQILIQNSQKNGLKKNCPELQGPEGGT